MRRFYRCSVIRHSDSPGSSDNGLPIFRPLVIHSRNPRDAFFRIWLVLFFALGCSAETAPYCVWHAYRGQEQVAFETALERYAEVIEIRIDVLENPADAYYGKLESASPRGNGLDVFIGAHERVGSWAASVWSIHRANPIRMKWNCIPRH